MIKFIHTYTENSIGVLLESGLFKKGHGLKIMHKPEFTAPYDFNTICKKGSPLHKLLTELSCPFYIDRLQGGLGCPVKYNYDKELLGEYKNSEEISFLGLQMHEWASNYRSDQLRIAELCKKEGISPGTSHKNPSFWERVKNKSLSLFLEAYTPEEWSTLPLSASRDSFIKDCERLYKKRAKETDGLIFPTDSYFMAYRTAIKNGAKMLLPEVGWQIPNMRLQLAYTRGMAKSADIPWGIYYECWYCDENGRFTIPYSLTDSVDDWRETFGEQGFGNELPSEKREYGGSSLSLAERAWVYAYFSGAVFFGEEYGICNTFRSIKSTCLSPYGEAKKHFIDLTERYTPAGELYKPFAVVLPREMEILDERLRVDYLDYPPDEDGFFTAEYMKKFISDAESIFGRSGAYGNMGHTLTSGGLPDFAEIIHDDMEASLADYEYIIDLTGKNQLKNTYSNVISIEQAKEISINFLPFRIPDSLHVTVRINGKTKQLLIMNNDGILHKNFTPDIKIPEADVTTDIPCDGTFTLEKIEGTGKLTQKNDSCRLCLKGGEWIILNIS